MKAESGGKQLHIHLFNQCHVPQSMSRVSHNPLCAKVKSIALSFNQKKMNLRFCFFLFTLTWQSEDVFSAKQVEFIEEHVTYFK
jgi:hypothetical protein